MDTYDQGRCYPSHIDMLSIRSNFPGGGMKEDTPADIGGPMLRSAKYNRYQFSNVLPIIRLDSI